MEVVEDREVETDDEIDEEREVETVEDRVVDRELSIEFTEVSIEERIELADDE